MGFWGRRGYVRGGFSPFPGPVHSCPAAVKLVNDWWKMAADVDTTAHAYTRFRAGRHVWWRHRDRSTWPGCSFSIKVCDIERHWPWNVTSFTLVLTLSSISSLLCQKAAGQIEINCRHTKKIKARQKLHKLLVYKMQPKSYFYQNSWYGKNKYCTPKTVVESHWNTVQQNNVCVCVFLFSLYCFYCIFLSHSHRSICVWNKVRLVD